MRCEHNTLDATSAKNYVAKQNICFESSNQPKLSRIKKEELFPIQNIFQKYGKHCEPYL